MFFKHLNYELKFLPAKPDKIETVPIYRASRHTCLNNYKKHATDFYQQIYQ